VLSGRGRGKTSSHPAHRGPRKPPARWGKLQLHPALAVSTHRAAQIQSSPQPREPELPVRGRADCPACSHVRLLPTLPKGRTRSLLCPWRHSEAQIQQCFSTLSQRKGEGGKRETPRTSREKESSLREPSSPHLGCSSSLWAGVRCVGPE